MRIQQVQNTTSCHNFGSTNLNSIRISTVPGGTVQTKMFSTNQKGPGTNSSLLRNARLNLHISCTENVLKIHQKYAYVSWLQDKHFASFYTCVLCNSSFVCVSAYLWMCAFFRVDSSVVCISAYAYGFKFKVHCGPGVPFDAGRFRASLLLHTICVQF